jgi:hypothetical protein
MAVDLDKCHIGTMQPQLRCIFTIPSESNQGVVAGVVREFHSVLQNGSLVPVSLARPPRPLRHASVLIFGVTIEPVFRGVFTTPVSVHAIWMHVTGLAVHIGAAKYPRLEAGFHGSEVVLSRSIRSINELRHNRIIRTDAVTVDTSMVSDIRHTPLNVNHLPCLIGGLDRSPVVVGFIPGSMSANTHRKEYILHENSSREH